MVEPKYVLTEIRKGVGVLKIDRPAALNALSSQVVEQLHQALQALEHEPAVKVVLLCSTSDKAFIAGGDLKEMSSLDPGLAEAYSRKGQELVLFIDRMKIPVIAEVGGYALGGGLELALACDFIYASEDAKFGFPEVSLGVIPGFGGTRNLARLIGPARARELILSGKVLSARQAMEWGIVNAVFPPAELPLKAMETAGIIAGFGRLALAAAKDAVTRGLNMTGEEAFHNERSLFASLFATLDQKEGMQAFLEKRQAQFKDQ